MSFGTIVAINKLCVSTLGISFYNISLSLVGLSGFDIS